MFAKLLPVFQGLGFIVVVLIVVSVIIGGVVGILQSASNLNNMPDYNVKTVTLAIQPAMVATGGKLFSKEVKMSKAVELLLNKEELARSQPLIFDEAFFLSKQQGIIISIVSLFALWYILFKIGNWLAGFGQFTPTTDLAIAFLIILVFFLIEWIYVLLFEPSATFFYPFKGFIDVIVNYKVVFNLDTIMSSISSPIATNTFNSTVEILKNSTINLTG